MSSVQMHRRALAPVLLFVTSMVSGAPQALAQSLGTIGSGSNHNCATLADGTLQCWGHQEENQIATGYYAFTVASAVPLVGIDNAVGMTGGYESSCFLLETGQVKCVGWNAYGQSGTGATNCTYAEGASACALVVGLNDAVDLDVGGGHACAVRSAGQVLCWGHNGEGRLGADPAVQGNSNIPIAVAGLDDARKIAAGGGHNCAIVRNGEVECWGNNNWGQLGLGGTDQTAHPSPTAVAGITNAIAITAGDRHTCVLRAGGAVSCFGHEDYGALGQPDTNASSQPLPITSSIAGVVEIDAGAYHTCGRTAAGQVLCTGYNYYGNLGDGSNRNNRFTAVVFQADLPALEISTGDSLTCVKVSANPLNVKCAGFGVFGELGDGGFGGTHERPNPAYVQGGPLDEVFGGRAGSFENP